jgi:hypothetical protein
MCIQISYHSSYFIYFCPPLYVHTKPISIGIPFRDESI